MRLDRDLAAADPHRGRLDIRATEQLGDLTLENVRDRLTTDEPARRDLTGADCVIRLRAVFDPSPPLKVFDVPYSLKSTVRSS